MFIWKISESTEGVQFLKKSQKMFEKGQRCSKKGQNGQWIKKLSKDVSLKNNGGGRVTANCSMMPIF